MQTRMWTREGYQFIEFNGGVMKGVTSEQPANFALISVRVRGLRSARTAMEGIRVRNLSDAGVQKAECSRVRWVLV